MTSAQRRARGSSTPSNAELERRAKNIGAMFRLRRPERFAEMYRLRSRSSATNLFHAFPKVFSAREDWDVIHGPAFPRTLAHMFSKKAIVAPAGPLNEIIWAICRCLQYGNELASFVSKRVEFEHALLSGASAGEELLDSVEDELGCSFWLVQNRLACAQFRLGLEESRRQARVYEEQAGENWLAKLLLRYASKRIEATGIKNYLKTELKDFLDPEQFPDLARYVRAKTFDLPDIDVDDIAPTLFFEAQSSLIDYYETLVLILQAAVSSQAIQIDVAPLVATPLLALYKRTRDRRLEGVLRGVGLITNVPYAIDSTRATAVEHYTKGEYQALVDRAMPLLRARPSDVAMLVLLVKSCVQMRAPVPPINPFLDSLADHLRKVVTLAGDEAFLSAYAVITLAERFYGHTWVIYARAVVYYELREEQLVFPPIWLRDIYVRDEFLTPFSAIAIGKSARAHFLALPELAQNFKNTLGVYRTITEGVDADTAQISRARQRAYLARYHLTNGNAALALDHFMWLIEETEGGERARCHGGAALALLKLGDKTTAVDLVVASFLENHQSTTVLPIKPIVDALDDPRDWSDSIRLPLLLELHASQVNAEKLSQLRYAFERFQLAHGIVSPTDLAATTDKWGRAAIVAYLDRVWRPEIMRQTVLYQGTREIEEARIKVCRLLAELDAKNSEKYLDEIKNRVKKQEIAKGTSLLQQSKVYVDVEAIRKTLRAKLSEPYSRYKTSSGANQVRSGSSLLHQITDAVADQAAAANVSIPKILSSLHIVGDSESPGASEADAQFAALFEEVTNEFLRGDHGLNAYLSTRVRHGTLSNTLRKAVADERLVTQRKEGSDTYVPNTYWFSQPTFDRERYRSVFNALDRFSAEFDQVIRWVNDALIQITIVHEFKATGTDPEALFVYRSSNLERRFIQEYDKTSERIDDLINRCIETLWEKTDENLSLVQRVLKTDVKTRLMRAFDRLLDEVNSFSYLPGIPDLANAIAQARTGTNTKLALVSSWFKRSEVYDRQDYSPDFPVHVAMNMLTSTISNASTWTGMNVNTRPEVTLLPGRTLDGLVDVFYGLFENAIKHSGLDADLLSANVDIAFNGGCYVAAIENNLAAGRPTGSDREKVEKLRAAIGRSDSRRKAQLEGGSGLHKIWRALNSSLYLEPSLDFGFEIAGEDDHKFKVNLSFKLERFEDESAAS
jgi:hypothetical protein